MAPPAAAPVHAARRVDPSSRAKGLARIDRELPLDDVLARAVLARVVETGPAPPPAPVEALQRTYHRADGATWTQRTDEDAEYDELSTYVNSTAPEVDDIRTRWQGRGAKKLTVTIERMMSDAVRGAALAVIAEAFGRRQPNRTWRFKDKEQAARAVLGESYREEGEQKERALADEVMASARILAGIRSYMGKVGTFLAALRTSGDIDDTFLAKKGIYHYYYQGGLLNLIFAKPVTAEDVVKSYQTQEIRPLIAAIKDITTAFYDHSDESQALWDAVVTPVDKQYGGSPNSGGSIDQETIDTIRPEGVLDETTASMKYARENKMLVDVGPSFTTGRAMQLGTAIGATDFELMAVALGFFAFWNREYWRGTSGIHHFHYVMDMLDNYAVGSYPYAGYPDSIDDILP